MLDIDTILILLIGLIGTNVINTLTSWALQKHLIQKLEKYIEKKKNSKV